VNLPDQIERPTLHQGHGIEVEVHRGTPEVVQVEEDQSAHRTHHLIQEIRLPENIVQAEGQRQVLEAHRDLQGVTDPRQMVPSSANQLR